MCINCARKSKNKFFAIFLTLVALIDSVLHIMRVLNISEHVAVVIGPTQLNRYA